MMTNAPSPLDYEPPHRRQRRGTGPLDFVRDFLIIVAVVITRVIMAFSCFGLLGG